MRTIKFRGKNKDGKWVFGDFVHPYVILEDEDVDLVLGKAYLHNSSLVFQDTVGQFTGLCDKNGKEIYEGDILLWTRKNVHIEGRPLQDLLFKCKVYYDNDKCAFQFRCKLKYGACVGNLDFDDDRADESYIEIIGNVFDNSDLIEKGGEQ